MDELSSEDLLRPAALTVPSLLSGSLREALQRRSADQRRRLRGVAVGSLLFVVGEEGLLPWFPGVLYLGSPAGAPGLLIPTWARLSVPADLAVGALRSAFGEEGQIGLLPKSFPNRGARPEDLLACSLSGAYRLNEIGMDRLLVPSPFRTREECSDE